MEFRVKATVPCLYTGTVEAETWESAVKQVIENPDLLTFQKVLEVEEENVEERA